MRWILKSILKEKKAVERFQWRIPDARARYLTCLLMVEQINTEMNKVAELEGYRYSGNKSTNSTRVQIAIRLLNMTT